MRKSRPMKTAGIIDGKAIANAIQAKLKQQIEAQSGSRPPGLAVVLVGDDSASKIYVNNKRIACQNIGIKSHSYDLDTNTTQSDLLQLIDDLNQNPEVDGILVQLPLPEHIDSTIVIGRIAASKDVDGFHPYNVGRLAQRIPLLRPCTPAGVMALLQHIEVDVLGRHAVIIGASNHVGRPMALELLLQGATVSVCHRFTPDIAPFVAKADILIAAAGKPGLIKGEWIKPGSVVIDVGMNRATDGKLCGDIEFEAAAARAAWITPVPGGVGPMTVAMLMSNTVQAYQAHIGA